MKRLNYYQVHKNKKPIKRKVKIKFNPFISKIGLTTILSSMEVKKIIENHLLSRSEKAIKIFNSVLNCNTSIVGICKEQKKQRYLNRIK